MTDYEDTVGSLHGGPYGETGAYLRDCGTCGAKGDDDPKVSEKCKVQTFFGVKPKHAPCLSRYLGRENR